MTEAVFKAPAAGSGELVRPLRILLVEDHPADAELCLVELRKSGFEVHADMVSTLEEFSARLDANAYDIILADYRLPNWTGMEALELAQQRGKEIPLLLVTGSLGEEAAVECLKQGASDYVLKDRLARLPFAVRRALAEKALREERARAEQALREAYEQLVLSLEEMQQRSREATRVSEMAELLQSSQTAEEAYKIVGRAVPELFPVESGALCVLGSSHNLVEAVVVWGKSPPEEQVFARDDCWALRLGRVHRVDDPKVGQLCRHVGAAPAAGYLCVPLLAQGEVLGVLHVLSSPHSASEPEESRKPLSGAEQRLAVTLAEHIALALANLRLHESLRQQSIRDTLTGLFNRRYLEESLERELRRAIRKQRPLGLILLDVDNFKSFNDTFGHDAGDTLLRELGHFLQGHTRREDIACRYGGEEFTLILPEVTLDTTRQRAEQLREEVKCLHIQYRGRALGRITLSLGVAAYPDHGSTAEALLRAADIVLYHAKEGGRDRVIVRPGVRKRAAAPQAYGQRDL